VNPDRRIEGDRRGSDTLFCIYVKVGFTCTACEGFVPLNAFVEKIRCNACGREFDFTPEYWESLLDDPLQEVSHMQEGEGRHSTIFGDFNYRLEYGRICPKFPDSDVRISADELLGGIDSGYVSSPDGNGRVPVRAFVDVFEGKFPGIVAFVGEDQSLLPGTGGDEILETTGSSRPIALHCPNCGGSLIVNGKQRKEDCRYCGTSVTLPDELWQMLHPAKKSVPWYILYDETRVPFSWDGETYDALPDGKGNLVMAVDSEYSDCPEISCIDSDRKILWSRDDLPVDCEGDEYSPGMVSCPNGSLLLVHEEEKILYRISMEDGSLIESLEDQPPAPADANPEEPAHFSLQEVRSITCQPDGSLIVLKRLDIEHGHYYNELLRYDESLKPAQLWQVQEKEKKGPGLFQLIRKFFTTAGPDRPPYFSELEDRPTRMYDSPNHIVSGDDGSIYMLYSGTLAAFDPEGMKRYSVEVPYRWVWGRPVPFTDGRVLLLVEESENFRIACVSATGTVSELASGIGEEMDDPTLRVIALDDNGILHVFGYGGEWVTLNVREAMENLSV
jgi:predicted RNA-binding Zn-ribbon protein involved in translation (DUF1610 family)